MQFANLNLNLLNETRNAVIFCYLIEAGSDYPYNLGRNFQEAIAAGIWDNDELNINSYLTKSRISTILKNLETEKLVILNKQDNRSYYRINPEVFLNEKIIKGRILSVEELAKLLEKTLLEIYSKFNPDKLIIIKQLNSWKKFNFYTVLQIMKRNLSNYLSYLVLKVRKEREDFDFIKGINFEDIDLDKVRTELDMIYKTENIIHKKFMRSFKYFAKIKLLITYFERYMALINLSYYRKDIDLDLVLFSKKVK